MLDSTCNAIGNFIATALLYPTYTIFMATAFLPFFLLDPYIRTFVSGCQPHSCHRHFIDPRPIDRTIHLWTAFHICLTALFGRFSADFNVLCQRRILHSFASNVVSGERFRALPHHSTLQNRFRLPLPGAAAGETPAHQRTGGSALYRESREWRGAQPHYTRS